MLVGHARQRDTDNRYWLAELATGVRAGQGDARYGHTKI